MPARINWKFAALGVVVIATTAFSSSVFPRLEVVTSESIDKRIFIKTDETPYKNAYVRFELSHEAIPGGRAVLTKKLACFAGDNLEVDTDYYFCNGMFLGIGNWIDKNGERRPNFVFNGIIPPGKAFAFGTHANSFDSRYWGFLDLESQPIVVLRPVF